MVYLGIRMESHLLELNVLRFQKICLRQPLKKILLNPNLLELKFQRLKKNNLRKPLREISGTYTWWS